MLTNVFIQDVAPPVSIMKLIITFIYGESTHLEATAVLYESTSKIKNRILKILGNIINIM